MSWTYLKWRAVQGLCAGAPNPKAGVIGCGPEWGFDRQPVWVLCDWVPAVLDILNEDGHSVAQLKRDQLT